MRTKRGSWCTGSFPLSREHVERLPADSARRRLHRGSSEPSEARVISCVRRCILLVINHDASKSAAVFG